MKQLVINFIFCFCITLNLSAQNYVAEYQSIGQSGDAKGHLIFNAKEWLYNVTTLVKTGGFTVDSNDIDVSDLNEQSTATDTVFSFNYRSLDKNKYLDKESSSSQSVFIRSELEKQEWNILSDSIKKIENYTCQMAKGFVRGRNYTVWFSPDIPVSAGPWKLWGLPGLIMSAQSDDGFWKITLISLKPTNLSPREPTFTKTITPAEFKAQVKETINKFKRRIVTLNLDSGSAEVTDVKVNNPDKSLFE